jgi:hypothetical protein
MDKHETPEPEILDLIASTMANLTPGVESGLTFAVSTPGIGPEATGGAMGASAGAGAEGPEKFLTLTDCRY